MQYTLVLETSALIGMRVELPPSPPSFSRYGEKDDAAASKAVVQCGRCGFKSHYRHQFHGALAEAGIAPDC